MTTRPMCIAFGLIAMLVVVVVVVVKDVAGGEPCSGIDGVGWYCKSCCKYYGLEPDSLYRYDCRCIHKYAHACSDYLPETPGCRKCCSGISRNWYKLVSDSSSKLRCVCKKSA